MTHRAPDTEVEPTRKPLASRMFADKYLPHWGIAAVTLLYIGMIALLGVAAVPPTINLAWTATLGTWFGYLIRVRANKEDD